MFTIVDANEETSIFSIASTSFDLFKKTNQHSCFSEKDDEQLLNKHSNCGGQFRVYILVLRNENSLYMIDKVIMAVP